MMTEEEAKTKTCCVGYGGPQTAHGNCIGSVCMAWRWYKFPTIYKPESGIPNETGTGFCGRAGTPNG